MGKEEFCYVDLYQTPIIGTGIALFHNGKSRVSLDNMLNAHDPKIPFSISGGKAYALYNRSLQVTGATTLFTRDLFPNNLEKAIKRIENGVEPNETLKLITSTDSSYYPARRKLSISGTTKGEEKPKDILRRIFTLYPILTIVREDPSNMNQPKDKGIKEVYLYDVSEETLRSGYDMGVFEIREDNGPQKIISKKKDGLLHLYTGYCFKVDAALRTAKLKALGDSSTELMKMLTQVQEKNGFLTQELIKYERDAGVNAEKIKELEQERDDVVAARDELFDKYKQMRQVEQEAALGRIDADLAEQQMKNIRERMFEPLGGKRRKVIEGADGSKLEIDYVGSGSESQELTSKGTGKDRISTV